MRVVARQVPRQSVRRHSERHTFVVAPIPLRVATRAESTVGPFGRRPGEDHDLHLVVAGDVLDRRVERRDQLAVESVPALRSVQRDDADPIHHLSEEDFVVQVVASLRRFR